MRRARRPVVVLAAAALVAAACGGDTPDTTPSDSEGSTMELSSTAFEEQGTIPVIYTCDGDSISPPLRIGDVPDETVSLTLIVDDPDAPAGTWDHWVAFDIPPMDEIAENVGVLGTAGRNSSGHNGYDGPCPPSGSHRYVFRVYAVDTELGLSAGASKEQVLEALEGHILAEGTLIGQYGR